MNSDSRQACSIRVFLPDGDPDGLRFAERTMSTTQAIAFRRSLWTRAEASFREFFGRPGVYLLLGSYEETERPKVYVGHAEDWSERLGTHKSSETKEFWVSTIVLASKDENLTKSHAMYVESKLIDAARSNQRWSLQNDQKPDIRKRRLPLPDRCDMDRFAEEAMMLVGILGCDLFRQEGVASEDATTARQDEHRTDGGDVAVVSGPTFWMRGKGYDARMRMSPSGRFIVEAGSKARVKEVPSLPDFYVRLRNKMREAAQLTEDGEHLVFATAYDFDSVSQAAYVVSGSSVNGRNAWKVDDGRTYGQWETPDASSGIPGSPLATPT